MAGWKWWRTWRGTEGLRRPPRPPRENQKTAIVQRGNARELLDDFLGNRRLKGRKAERGVGVKGYVAKTEGTIRGGPERKTRQLGP